MAGTITGNLIIRPKFASLMRDTEPFGKMSPYVLITFGGQRERTRVAHRGGRNPQWQDQVVLRRFNEIELSLEVYDKGKASNDHLVGKTSLNIDFLLTASNSFEGTLDLISKNRKAGDLTLSISWAPDAKQKHQDLTQSAVPMFMSGSISTQSSGSSQQMPFASFTKSFGTNFSSISPYVQIPNGSFAPQPSVSNLHISKKFRLPSELNPDI